MSNLSRSQILLGEDGIIRLRKSSILLVGVGGVGGYVLECLVRAGIEDMTIVDGDIVDETNLNRQLISTSQNIGRAKVDEFCQRIALINPKIKVRAIRAFYSAENSGEIFDKRYDYCIDCFDRVKDKIHFIVTAKKLGFPIISAMGAGNRLSEAFEVTDIFKTFNDKLAKKLRGQLKAEGVTSLKVVCDRGTPICTDAEKVGSISYIPAIMGCMIAGEVIRDIVNVKE